MASIRHDDCGNFVPVDVAKGYCRVNESLIFIDTPICKSYEAIPKCKFCGNYVAGSEPFIGDCKASKCGDWTYEDLRASHCEGFVKA